MNNLVMANLVNTNFSAEFQNKGQVVNMPIAPTMTSNLIGETGTVTTQNPSMGNVAVSLDYHREATFQIPDVTQLIAQPDLIKTYSESAVVALAEGIDEDIWSVSYPQLIANAAVGGASVIDEARIDDAETALFNAKTPGDSRNLVVSGTSYGKLRQIGRFSEMLTYGTGTPIASGQVLQVKGFNVFRTQKVPKPSTVRYNLAFHKNAIALATRPLPAPPPGMGVVSQTVMSPAGNFGFRVLMSYDANGLGTKVTVDVLYGVGVPRPTYGVQVQTSD